MTVTYNLADNVGKVRLKIGDTTLTDYKFTDEEIGVFLTNQSNDINLAAAEALESWASTYAQNAASEKIGDYAYTQKIMDNMLKLAASLRELDSSTPDLDWAEFDLTYGSGITAEED